MTRAASDIHRRPAPMPSRRGGAGPSAGNSTSSHPALARAGWRQCRAATRPLPAGHGYRASPHGGLHRRRALREAAARVRSRAAGAMPHAPGRHGVDRREDRGRTTRPASVRARPAPRAPVRVRHDDESGDASRPAQRYGSAGRPIALAGTEGLLGFAPRALAGRTSMPQGPNRAPTRPACLRSLEYQAAARKVRPQGDHLLANGCSGRSTIGRADRETSLIA